MSNDRAAVARGVLTEIANAHRELGFTAIVDVMESWRDEHYPAPPAPETVTVAFRDGSTETLYSQGGQWQSGTGLLYDELIERACFDRIASDARVIQERDARIAELERERDDMSQRHTDVCEKWSDENRRRVRLTERIAAQEARIAELETQLQRALDGAVFHEKRAHHAEQERDAALRALEDWKQAALTLGESLTPNGPDGYYAMTPAEWLKWAKAATSQGEGLAEKGTVNSEDAKAQVVREPTRPASPAPIPLGAVVDVQGLRWAPFTRADCGWFDKDGDFWSDSDFNGMFATALYHARHPVATRETVERVVTILRKQAWSSVPFTHRAEEILTAAGITLEEGA